MQDLVGKGEAVAHIVPTTANYLRFLAILVSGAYAPVVLMPRQTRYQFNVDPEMEVAFRVHNIENVP